MQLLSGPPSTPPSRAPDDDELLEAELEDCPDVPEVDVEEAGPELEDGMVEEADVLDGAELEVFTDE